MKKIFLALILGIFLFSLVSANLIVTPEPTQAIRFNESHNFYLSVYNNSTGEVITNANCNLSIYNSTGILKYSGSYVYSSPSYSLNVINTNFTQEDILTYKIYCSSGTEGGKFTDSLLINMNGNGEPSDFTIVFFSGIMLFLFAFGIVYLIRVIALLGSLSVDLLDVGYMWGAYFALLMLNRLEIIYLGNVEISNWLNTFVSWGGIPFILIPIIAFIISLIANKKEVKKEKERW